MAEESLLAGDFSDALVGEIMEGGLVISIDGNSSLLVMALL